MATRYLTREAAKAALGDMPERTFARWCADGLPRKGDGKAAKYPWPEVFRWLLDQVERRGRESGRSDPQSPSGRRDEAEARIALARAEQAELDLAERRRETMSVVRYRDVLSDAMGRVRAQLLVLPNKAAPALVGLPTPAQAKIILERYVQEVCEELHAARDLPVGADAKARADDEDDE